MKATYYKTGTVRTPLGYKRFTPSEKTPVKPGDKIAFQKERGHYRWEETLFPGRTWPSDQLVYIRRVK